jgi:hypothetical protein
MALWENYCKAVEWIPLIQDGVCWYCFCGHNDKHSGSSEARNVLMKWININSWRKTMVPWCLLLATIIVLLPSQKGLSHYVCTDDGMELGVMKVWWLVMFKSFMKIAQLVKKLLQTNKHIYTNIVSWFYEHCFLYKI